MTTRNFALIGTLILTVAATAMSACSSGGESTTTKDQTATNEACKAKSKDDCHTCCLDAYSSEWNTYQTTYAWPCICKAGTCDTDCANSACASPAVDPDDANDNVCNTCQSKALDMGGACMAASINCLKDQNCKPVLSCLMGCQ